MNDDLKDVGDFMGKQVEAIARFWLPKGREIAQKIDKDTGIGNLGMNVLINAYSHLLEETLADFAEKAGRDREQAFQEFSLAFHNYINDWIAKLSNSGVSVMIDLREKDQTG